MSVSAGRRGGEIAPVGRSGERGDKGQAHRRRVARLGFMVKARRTQRLARRPGPAGKEKGRGAAGRRRGRGPVGGSNEGDRRRKLAAVGEADGRDDRGSAQRGPKRRA
ncbi:MAG: hypothetical protein AMXMBFR66_13210 [Pseudomonadota bacterium]